MSNKSSDAKSLPPLKLRQVFIEFLIIFAVFLWVTSHFHQFSSDILINNLDIVPLSRSADFAGHFLRTEGAIPLWNPFIGNGEPMLEAVSSFILNPFMSLPSMLLGARPGVLITILLHGLLMGIGGWVLARVIGLHAAGRVFIGILLISNGSYTGALSHGVFQLSQSQAYIPYVLAGMVTLLFLPYKRTGMLLFVTTTMLLIFSGSFWYVLPVAFTCALIGLFAFINPRADRKRILKQLITAGLFVVGCSAIRLFTMNRDLLYHTYHSYDYILSYTQVFYNFFDPNYTHDMGRWFIVYHYIVPALTLTVIVLFAMLTFWKFEYRFTGGWTVILAGIVSVGVFAFFGMGPTPELEAVHEALPVLRDWRNTGRMAAAATPWVILAVGWLFDRVFSVLLQIFQTQHVMRFLGMAGIISLSVLALWSAENVGVNWRKSVYLEETEAFFSNENRGASLLREQYPSAFLSIHSGWILHYALNDNLIRHPYGDNEVFTMGLPPTIGAWQPNFLAEFTFGDDPESGNGMILLDNGYVEMPEMPIDPLIGALIDRNPRALAYAFVTSETTIIENEAKQMFNDNTTPATYYHRMDEIEVLLDGSSEEDVLVVQETAYPGWRVSINGDTVPIESVNGRIAVRLPQNAGGLHVLFEYKPLNLYVTGAVTVISIFILIGYSLHVDQHLKRRTSRSTSG